MKVVTRRKALEQLQQLAVAATALACTPRAGAQGKAAAKETPMKTQASMTTQAPVPDTVLRVEPLRTPWQTMDPFLFCMHHDDAYPAGNAQFGPGEAALAGRNIGADFSGLSGWSMYHGDVVPGFPQHPHRGFETVTVVRKGLLDHSDSLGAAARYGQGDVQWLTAGGGIQHAEMFPLLNQDTDNPCELFQIWLNLPARDKMVPAHFSMLWAPAIPRHDLQDAAGRAVHVATVAGSLAGVTPPKPPPHSWAARPDSDVAIWTVKLAAGATWTLPPAQPGSNRNLYFFRGSGLTVGTRAVPPGSLVVVQADVPTVLVAGAEESEVLVLQGRPIGEPGAQYWPFVMNTRQELQQTFEDFRRTGFGGWPWPGLGPVHGAQPERFARRPDGTVEKPA